MDVANLVDLLLHGRNLGFDSVTKQAKVCWDRIYPILDDERNTGLQIWANRCAILILLKLKSSLHLLLICSNLSFGRSKYLRIGSWPIGLKLSKTNESLTGSLSNKRLRFGGLIKLEAPIFLIGIAGSSGVDNKGAVSYDFVKHYLK